MNARTSVFAACADSKSCCRWCYQVEIGNKPLTAFSQNEDFAGFDMYYGWITSVHHNRRYIGKFLGTREDQADQEQIGEA